MNFQTPGQALPDNVVMFPGARRHLPMRPAARGQVTAISGAELNARLMLLLGICVGGATILVSAVHFLQG